MADILVEPGNVLGGGVLVAVAVGLNGVASTQVQVCKLTGTNAVSA